MRAVIKWIRFAISGLTQLEELLRSGVSLNNIYVNAIRSVKAQGEEKVLTCSCFFAHTVTCLNHARFRYDFISDCYEEENFIQGFDNKFNQLRRKSSQCKNIFTIRRLHSFRFSAFFLDFQTIMHKCSYLMRNFARRNYTERL